MRFKLVWDWYFPWTRFQKAKAGVPLTENQEAGGLSRGLPWNSAPRALFWILFESLRMGATWFRKTQDKQGEVHCSLMCGGGSGILAHLPLKGDYRSEWDGKEGPGTKPQLLGHFFFCQFYSNGLRLIWGSASINGVCLIARKFTVVSGNSDVVRPSAYASSPAYWKQT